jgi:hypothetical protein
MTKVRIRKAICRTKWQLVTFLGPNGGESIGIVDLVAIRKHHAAPSRENLKRGDLFEIILIQVKGGTAAWPTFDEILRLREVGRFYRAKAILLASWKPGKQVDFLRLRSKSTVTTAVRDHWIPLDSLDEVFR